MATPAVNNLIDHAASQLRGHADRLNAGKLTPARFHDAVLKTLADANTAAYLRGTADRLGIREGSALLKRSNLSRAERADITAATAKQAPFLNGFVDAIERGDLSPAQIAARAESYAGSANATYAEANAPGLPFYPGDGGTACLGHCKCDWQQRGGDWYWTLGASEHCDDCLGRADGNPY